MKKKRYHKIRFYDPDVGYENLKAEKAESLSEGLYVIKSIPYFIYNISVDDIVRAEPDPTDNVLSYLETVRHSSHKTIRVRPTDFVISQDRGKTLLDKLEDFGCGFETLPPRLIAVDLPDEALAQQVTEYLTSNSIRWEWASPS